MYNPKDIFTEDSYDDYRAHLKNIENGLFYLKNNYGDLHIGALSTEQANKFWALIGAWKDLEEVLKTGDGEKDNE